MLCGDPIRVFFTSADATTGAPIAIYDDGSDVARTLAADERVILTDIVVFAADAVVTATIFNDADDDNAVDAGEQLAILGPGTHTLSYEGGLAGKQGILPHVIAGMAGQVSVTGRGVVIKS